MQIVGQSVRRQFGLPCRPSDFVLYLCGTSLVCWDGWWFINTSCFVSKPRCSRQVKCLCRLSQEQLSAGISTCWQAENYICKCFINNSLCRTFCNDNSNVSSCLLQCWVFDTSLSLLIIAQCWDLESLMHSPGSGRLFWTMRLLQLLVRQK